MSRIATILRRLEKVDCASLCDADKSLGRNAIQVMSSSMIARTPVVQKMIGVARTVQLSEHDDFLAVLRGLHDAEKGEVLCVNTMGSTKAVAGGLFLSESERKGLRGLIVDGAVRDISLMQQSSIHCYSTTVNPYSGTIQSPGEMQNTILCGDAKISPGDIVVGDSDGVISISVEAIEDIIEMAETIVSKEDSLIQAMKEGESLHSQTNYEEHIARIQNGKESSFQLK